MHVPLASTTKPIPTEEQQVIDIETEKATVAPINKMDYLKEMYGDIGATTVDAPMVEEQEGDGEE